MAKNNILKYPQQIIDFAWTGKNYELRPVCKLLNLKDSSLVDLELTLPYNFAWELSSEKYCVGYHDAEAGGYVACPQQSEVQSQYERCPNCSAKDGFKQAFFFGEEPNERMVKHLAKEHYIYLAFFHPNTVKVGTVVANRKYKRLVEQDALLALIVATAPGNKIQELEHYISKTFTLPESVRTRQKLAAIKLKPSEERAKELLWSTWKAIKPKLLNTDFASWLMQDGEVEAISHISNKHLFFPEVEKQLHQIASPTSLVGEYKGLRAKQLILKPLSENGLNLYNTSDLVGKLINPQPALVNQPNSSRREINPQLNLFN